jgi:methionyl-tRNA formyltransferase
MNGEGKTGVTTILMNEWMDAGDVFLQRETIIEQEDDALTLSQRLSTLGAKLLLETISQLKKEILTPIPQNHSKASYAPALKKKDGRIDWGNDARSIHNQIRGTLPWPGAFTNLENKRLKIFKSQVVECTSQDSPGNISQINAEGIKVATGKGSLLLTDIQLQDRKRLNVKEFIKGHPIPIGTMLT